MVKWWWLVFVGLTWMAGGGRAMGAEHVKVAVWLVEARGTPLSGDELVGLSDYLAAKIAESDGITGLPLGVLP